MYYPTSSLCILDLLNVGPWHKGVDVLVEVAIGELGEEITQIGIGFDAVHLAGADRAGEAVFWPGGGVFQRSSQTCPAAFVRLRSGSPSCA